MNRIRAYPKTGGYREFTVPPLEPKVSSYTPGDVFGSSPVVGDPGNGRGVDLTDTQKSAICKYASLVEKVNPIPEANRPGFYNMLQDALQSAQ